MQLGHGTGPPLPHPVPGRVVLPEIQMNGGTAGDKSMGNILMYNVYDALQLHFHVCELGHAFYLLLFLTLSQSARSSSVYCALCLNLSPISFSVELVVPSLRRRSPMFQSQASVQMVCNDSPEELSCRRINKNGIDQIRRQ